MEDIMGMMDMNMDNMDVLDVWESMIPFYEIGGIVRGMGKGTGRGMAGG